MWELTREEGNFGYAKRALRGHSHYVQVRRWAAAAGPLSLPPAASGTELPAWQWRQRSRGAQACSTCCRCD